MTRRREAEVAQKSALLETTLESMGQGLLAFDGELRLAAWNGRALDVMRAHAGLRVGGAALR